MKSGFLIPVYRLTPSRSADEAPGNIARFRTMPRIAPGKPRGPMRNYFGSAVKTAFLMLASASFAGFSDPEEVMVLKI